MENTSNKQKSSNKINTLLCGVTIAKQKKPNSVQVQIFDNPRKGKSANFTVYNTTPEELKKILIELLNNAT